MLVNYTDIRQTVKNLKFPFDNQIYFQLKKQHEFVFAKY